MSENQTALVADISAAYFANNPTSSDKIADVITSIANALGGTVAPAVPVADAPVPKVDPKKSIAKDGSVLISLEDGKPYKTLKRHLHNLGMTPADYRAKWGLPSDYPMVSKSYSEQRAVLARSTGLGSKGRNAKQADTSGGVV